MVNLRMTDLSFKNGSKPETAFTYITLKDWDNNNNKSYTCGFANRLSLKSINLEMDMLAHLKQKVGVIQVFGDGLNENYNSVNIQNLSLGYSIKNSKFKTLEVFVNARNIYSNHKSNITDGRKFYGLGFKSFY